MTDLLAWLLLILFQDVIVALHALRQAMQEMFRVSVQVGEAVVEAIASRLLVVGLVSLGVVVFVAILVYLVRDAQPAAAADAPQTARG